MDFKVIKFSVYLPLLGAFCLFLVGCGGSSSPEVPADQDEIARYVQENPESLEESDGSGIDGAE